MAKKEQKVTLAKLQKEAQYLHIALPYDSREQYGILEFSNSPDEELKIIDNHKVPMLDRKTLMLNLEIDLKERRMLNWKPKYGYWRMWGKVKHYGTYTLLDANKVPLWQIHGFVPTKMVPPLEKGWGDYIDICVNSDGSIGNWPEVVDCSDFIENGCPPEQRKSYRWHLVRNAIHQLSAMQLDMEELSMLRISLWDTDIVSMIVKPPKGKRQ